MTDFYQYSSEVNVLDRPQALTIPEKIKANSFNNSKQKDASGISWFQSFKRYLPIITFDLVSLTLVLLTCYELISAKLIVELSNSEAFLTINLDKVIFYASLVFIILALFMYSGLYVHHVIQTRAKQFFYILKSFFYADVVIVMVAFFFFSTTISDPFKKFMLLFTISGVLFVFSGRMLFRYLIKNNKSLSTLKPPRRLIILGAGEAAKLYVAKLVNDNNSIDSIIFLDDDPTKHGSNIFGYPVEGNTKDVTILAAAFKADEICILINKISKERLLELVQYCNKTRRPVKISSTQYNLMFTGMYERKNQTLAVPLFDKNYNRLDLIYKRLMDLVGATIIGLIALVPTLIIAFFVKLTTKGPALHTSFRVGKDGNLFKMYKFRSMEINSGEQHILMAANRTKNGFLTGKLADDPRITPFGKFLRKYCLDELPQLLNVLKGEMSLVGPRPFFNYELEEYHKWQFRRFSMKPGMTGLWQITSRQKEFTLMDDALSTDVFYTDNYSIWMDFRILLKTIPLILSGSSK